MLTKDYGAVAQLSERETVISYGDLCASSQQWRSMEPQGLGAGISPVFPWVNDSTSGLVFQCVVWCGCLAEGIERHNQL